MAADEPEPGEDPPGGSWGFVAAMVALAVGLVALGCYFYSTGAPEKAALNAPISNSPEGIAMTS